MIITGRMSKACRALLDWSQQDLADKAGIAYRTVLDFEKGNRQPQPATLGQIARTFEDAGISFTPEGCVCPPKSV